MTVDEFSALKVNDVFWYCPLHNNVGFSVVVKEKFRGKIRIVPLGGIDTGQWLGRGDTSRMQSIRERSQ